MTGAEKARTSRVAVTGIVFIFRAVGAGSSLVALALMARTTSLSVTGSYLVASATAAVVSQVARRGVDGATFRLVSADRTAGRACIEVATRTAFPACALAATAFGLLAAAGALPGVLADPALVLAAPLVVTMAASNVLVEATKARRSPAVASLLETWPVPIALTTLLVTAGPAGRSVETLLAGHIAATLITIVALGVLSRGRSGGNVTSDVFRTSARRHHRLMIGNLVLANADVLYIGAVGSALVAGTYGVATRVASASSLVLGAVNGVAGPDLADGWNAGPGNVRAVLRRWTVPMAALAVAAGCAGVLTASLIAAVLGVPPEEAATPLRILIVGNAVALATGPMGVFLLVSGHEHLQQRATWLAVVVVGVGLLACLATATTSPTTLAAVAATAAAVKNIGSLLATRAVLRRVEANGF